MSITIHGVTTSRALRPLWAATELGLAFEHVNQPYRGGATREPAFLALNPNGHIPVVVDHRPPEQGGDIVVWESMACALYIARHHGPADGRSITPANPLEDAHALRWSFWAVNEAEADALTVLMHRLAMPAEQRKPALADAAEKRLRVPFRVLEQHLQRQQDAAQAFLASDRFTVADLCVASVLNWARPAQDLMTEFPLSAQWIARCIDRPAYAAARALGTA